MGQVRKGLPRLLDDGRGMFVQTKAIVLGVSKYSDSARMVSTYTEKFGRVDFSVKISRTRKSPFSAAYFQPLTLLEVDFDYRQTREVHYMRECKIVQPYCNMPYDAVKNSLSYFLAEVMQRTLRTQEQNIPLFSYLEESLCFLDATGERCANFHLLFMLGLCGYLGFAPNAEGYSEGCFFDMQAGCFTSQAGLHQDMFSEDDSKLLNDLLRIGFFEMHLLKMTAAQRNAMLRNLLRYYQIHLQGIGEFKTLSVLEMLFR